jgi:membrane protease YdiL (CAAX protease family)
MSASVFPTPSRSSPLTAAVASWAHTAVVLGIFATIAVAGALRQARAPANAVTAPSHQNLVALYISLIAAEWALVLYVRRGIRRTSATLTDLLGGPMGERRKVVTDVILAAGLWGIWAVVEAASARWWGPVSASTVRPFLAHRPAEIALWIALSVSAGFAEELVFRGYLQRQFAALTGSAALALVMQAVVFGVSHGYQGLGACARITVFGLLFGGLAAWQRRLRPGVIAHALTDIIAGLA